MGRSAIADFMREMTPSHSPPEGARLFLGGEVELNQLRGEKA